MTIWVCLVDIYVVCKLGGIGTVLVQNIVQYKLAIFTKILNYTKASYIILSTKYFNILVLHIAYKDNQHILV